MNGPGPPSVIVVMGVSGSGKTTLAEALAERLGRPFLEGDDLHPAANIAKMKRGEPLDDADRAPWLAAVAVWIARRTRDGEGGVVSCSALRRRYRDRLRADAIPPPVFILPDPSPALLAERLRHRTGHFMPPTLLRSQLATLERPDPDEGALVLDGARDIAALLAEAERWLGGR